MTVAPVTDELHGIADPIAFIKRALNDELRSRGASLPAPTFNDAVSFLYIRLRRLAQTYDPARGPSFSTWAYSILRKRYTDFLRELRGDSRYGNDGREESVADPSSLVAATAAPDALDFEALVDELDHDKLSTRARSALQLIARRVAEEGITASQAAADLAKSCREARLDIERLRQELGLP